MAMPPTTNRPFAVVTGASSGIGYELAAQFAQNGFDLLIVAEDGGLRVAAERLGSYGGEVDALTADLATKDGVDALCQRIHSSGRTPDAVAVNAGVGPPLLGSFLVFCAA
jgi:uncharacterized protein